MPQYNGWMYQLTKGTLAGELWNCMLSVPCRVKMSESYRDYAAYLGIINRITNYSGVSGVSRLYRCQCWPYTFWQFSQCLVQRAIGVNGRFVNVTASHAVSNMATRNAGNCYQRAFRRPRLVLSAHRHDDVEWHKGRVQVRHLNTSLLSSSKHHSKTIGATVQTNTQTVLKCCSVELCC